jgi:hypothetical protein
VALLVKSSVQGNSAQLLTTIMSSDYEYSDDDGDYYDEDDVMNIDEEGEEQSHLHTSMSGVLTAR